MFPRLAKFIFSFRYKVKVHGLQDIKEAKGCLILPNHISFFDSVIVYYSLRLNLRPLVTQTHFDKFPLNYLFKGMRGFSAPNFIIGTNLEKKHLWNRCLNEIAESLRNGDNVMFYPSGRLKVQAEEKVEGSSGLYQLLQQEKTLEVILVRTIGLWGSIFSTALHGKSPSLARQLLKGLIYYLANFFILTPKRKVEITVEKRTLHLSDFANKRALNLHLEEWYNKVEDPFYTPPYHFLFRPPPPKRILSIPPVRVQNQEILNEIVQIIGQMAGRPVLPTEHLAYDLSFDSIELSALLTVLEEKYGLTDLFTIELATAEHLAAMIERSWIPNRLTHELHKQQRNIEKFMKKETPCLDQLLGPVNLKQIGGQIKTFKRIFAHDPNATIPLLLAGGIESYSAYIAAHQLKKTPLFLKPEMVQNYREVYTTGETVVRWNIPSFNHSMGTLRFLPKKLFRGKWKPFDCALDRQAEQLIKGKNLVINDFFPENPELFISMTNVALRNKIRVILPFTGAGNTSWSKRVAAYLNHEIR